ncbi:MAG: RNHCP domain-containing protein [bacterium]
MPPGGAPVRDHCPWCLRGLHVDVVPGDRAADCGGVLDPYAIERRPPDVLLRLRCRACAHTFTVRAHPEDRVPPSLDVRDLPT